MRLLACPECRTQYDASGVVAKTIACRCGAAIENRDLPAVDVPVSRCSACGAIAGENARVCDYCGAEIVWKGPPGDLVCPECYARNPDAARFCMGCGVEFRPRPVVDPSAAPIECVRCGVPMTCRDVADTTIHECPKCASLWVPGDALDDLVRRVNDHSVDPSKGGDPRVQCMKDCGHCSLRTRLPFHRGRCLNHCGARNRRV